MAFPPHLTRKGKQIGRQGNHCLACMSANCEPSNQSFETDREATVCTASRRFLPFCGRFRKRAFRNALGQETPTALCVARVVALSAKRSPDKKTEHREAR